MKRLIGWRALAVLALVLAATLGFSAVAMAGITDIRTTFTSTPSNLTLRAPGSISYTITGYVPASSPGYVVNGLDLQYSDDGITWGPSIHHNNAGPWTRTESSPGTTWIRFRGTGLKPNPPGGTQNGEWTEKKLMVIGVLELWGGNRLDTACAVSQHAFPTFTIYYPNTTVVLFAVNPAQGIVLATASNYPDALSGGALAGIANAPILLVDKTIAADSSVAREIRRLTNVGSVNKIFVLGGESATTKAVFDYAVGVMGSAANVTRLGGATRYDTSEAILNECKALRGNGTFSNVLVTTGENFPDALACSSLSYKTDYYWQIPHAGNDKNVWPVILAESLPASAGLTPRVARELNTAGFPANIYIVGGESVVTAKMAQDLHTFSPASNRVRWGGANRYDTAIAVAKGGVALKVLKWNGVGFATGENFPDALTACSALANNRWPWPGPGSEKRASAMLLTPTAELYHSGVAGALWDYKSVIDRVTFFGGTSAISQQTRDDVISILQF